MYNGRFQCITVEFRFITVLGGTVHFFYTCIEKNICFVLRRFHRLFSYLGGRSGFGPPNLLSSFTNFSVSNWLHWLHLIGEKHMATWLNVRKMEGQVHLRISAGLISLFWQIFSIIYFLKYEHCDTVATDVLRALEEFVDLDYTEDVYGKFLCYVH